jgi:hypothetical protein
LSDIVPPYVLRLFSVGVSDGKKADAPDAVGRAVDPDRGAVRS